MKHYRPVLIAVFYLFFTGIRAATITVNNSGNSFVPFSVTITVGDAVNFVLSSNHDAREVSQATWNSNGSTPLSGGFQTAFGGGLVSAAQLPIGTHYYVCTPHVSFGMKGIIVVQSCVPAQPASIAGPASVCAGSSYGYTVPAVGGATAYAWTLPPGWSGTTTGTVVTITPGSVNGTLSVVASNSCGTSPAGTLAVKVYTSTPGATGPISGNTLVCSGSLQGYSVNTQSLASGWSWSLAAGWSGGSSQNTISVVAGSASGTIAVTATNACGSSAVEVLAISVSGTALPQPAPVNGNTLVCAGSQQVYTVALVSGATSYTWTLPSGWTGTSFTNSIGATAGQTGTLHVSAANFCGVSASRTLAIVVHAGPPAVPANISGTGELCGNTPSTFSVPAVQGAVSYSWSLPSGWTGTGTSQVVSATAGQASGILTVTAFNPCGTSQQTISVQVYTAAPAAPQSISGPTLVCRGEMMQYIASPAYDSLHYTWQLPVGWTGTSMTGTMLAMTFTSGGSVSVHASNICGMSALQTLAVTVQTVDTRITQHGDRLVAEAPGGFVQWVDCDLGMQAISGANSATFVPGRNGNFAMVRTINGCADTSACMAITETGIGAGTISTHPFSLLFSSDGSQITLRRSDAHPLVFCIISADGRKVMWGEVSGTHPVIGLESLSRGLYFINVSNHVFRLLRN
jgi:large repetitive protein